MTVVEIERALSGLGFDLGPADGGGGKRTIAAVKALQKKYILKADGLAREKTQAATGLALVGLSAPAPKPTTAKVAAIGAKGSARLTCVHPDLVHGVEAADAANPSAFVVTELLRKIERERDLLTSGASTIMKSRHITGQVNNLAAKVGDEIRWDWPLYQNLTIKLKTAAAAMNVVIKWVRDWRRLKFILHWNAYPA